MQTFGSIKELLSTLVREQKLLTEMFEKRKSLSYKYDFAVELVDAAEERIYYLLQRGVIKENGNFLELDDQFLQFFEDILEVNEAINISSINENINNIKENIIYYLKENNEVRKYNYLRSIKNTIRKIGNLTFRNVIDLKRNTENTFKNEPNYKVKKAKLENLDTKRIAITSFILQTDQLISQDEQTFFKFALDDELNHLIVHLKLKLNECSHNLIEIQKQIIEYLNQIKYKSGVIEKLRQIKYLRDQFTLRATSNINEIITGNNAVIFEANPTYPLKLSLAYLQENNEAYSSLLRVRQKIRSDITIKLPLAGKISNNYLQTTIEEEIQINLEEVRNSFLASGNNLFDFILSYKFEKEILFEEKVTIYCQLISQYEESFLVTPNYKDYQQVEYAMVYPK